MQSYRRRGSSLYRQRNRDFLELSSSPDNVKKVTETQEKPKLYKIRWFMLFLYCMSNFNNSFHWIEYSSIEDIVADYYQVSPTAVDSLSMIFYIGYCLFSIPASYILDKQGMRFTTLVGIGGTALAGWIKVLSVSRDRFYVTVIGQVVASIAQCFVFGINAQMAASWFGHNELALADGFGALGAQFGVAAGFVLPPLFVQDRKDMNIIGRQFRTLFYCSSIFSSIFFIFILFFFKERPPTPPSYAAVYSTEVNRKFKESCRNVFTNFNFILLLFAYSICQAVVNNVSTLINPLILDKFPHQQQEAGNIGLTSTVIGFIGSPIVGFIVDRVPIYKEVSVCLYVFMVLSFLGFAFSLYWANIVFVYISMAASGIGCTAFYTLGFQYGAELTYPEPESISGYFISIGTYVLSVIDLLIARWLLSYSAFHSNLYHVVFLSLGFLLTIFIRGELNRNQIEQSGAAGSVTVAVVAAAPVSSKAVMSASAPIAAVPLNAAVLPVTSESYMSLTVTATFVNKNAKKETVRGRTSVYLTSEDNGKDSTET